jgi:hypothetical protein
MVFLFDEQYLALAGDTLSLERKVKEKDERIEKLEAENMQLRQFCEEFNALSVAKENQKLKELLEECGIFLDVHRENDGNVFINDVGTSQIIDKINEALK